MGFRAPIGVLLAALCTRVSTVSIYRNSKVIELDVNNFWRYTGNVSAGEVSVVEAYVSWCPHCQRMAPAYRRFAAEAEPWAPAIHVTAVDCVAHDLLCRDLGVWGYPTLFLFGDLRQEVAAVDNAYSRIKHEGAFAEGYPAHAIHELWQWTLSWATPRTERVSTPQELSLAKADAQAAGLPLVLYVRSDWDPSSELYGAPPPPLAPVPAMPPPSPGASLAAPPSASSPPLPPSPPEDSLSSLFGGWIEEQPAAGDVCANLTQPACLAPEHGCEPVIDCWNAHWPASCQWWHTHDGWSFDVLRASGCPCRCRSPSPPPPPNLPPPPPSPPPSPPSPPSPPLLEMAQDALPPAQQAHLLVQLAYELNPMRFVEWVGKPVDGLYQRFGLDADEMDVRMPVIAILPPNGSAPALYPFDSPRYAAVSSWLASFQGGRKRGGLPTTARAGGTAEPLGLETGALAGLPALGSAGAPPVWPLPDAELRVNAMYTLESFAFAGRDCLGPQEQADLSEWILALAGGLGFDDADSRLLVELAGAVRVAPHKNICFPDWAAMLRALRQSGFGAPHNPGNHSSSCARGSHALTCTLWVSFHTLLASSTRESAARRLVAIRGFVRSFFACHECTRHFELMAAGLDAWLATSPPPEKRELALWLWRAHNTVAARVGLMDAAFADADAIAAAVAAAIGGRSPPREQAGRDSAGTIRPTRLLLFPSVEQCPDCHAPAGSGAAGGDAGGAGAGRAGAGRGGGAAGEPIGLGYFPEQLDANCPNILGTTATATRSPAPDVGVAREGAGGIGADANKAVAPSSASLDPAQPPGMEPCDDSELRGMHFRLDRVAAFIEKYYARPAAAERVRPPIVPAGPQARGEGAAGSRAGAAEGGASRSGGGSGGGGGSGREQGSSDGFISDAWTRARGSEGMRVPAGSAAGGDSAAEEARELRPFGTLDTAARGGVFTRAQGGLPLRGESERGSPVWLLLFVSALIAGAAAFSWRLRQRVLRAGDLLGSGGHSRSNAREYDRDSVRGAARFGAYRDEDDGDFDTNVGGDGELGGGLTSPGGARGELGGGGAGQRCGRDPNTPTKGDELELSDRPAWGTVPVDDLLGGGADAGFGGVHAASPAEELGGWSSGPAPLVGCASAGAAEPAAPHHWQ